MSEMNNKDLIFFKKLPLIVKLKIANHLSFTDLKVLGQFESWNCVLSNSSYWCFRYRFDDVKLARYLFEKLNDSSPFIPLDGRREPIFILAAEMDVTWLNGNYLDVIHDEILNQKVVRLIYVCFLNLQTVFSNVLPGRYTLLVQMRVEHPNVHGVTRITVSNESNLLGELILSKRHYELIEQAIGHRWFYFMIDKIQINALLENVMIRFSADDGFVWKSGLYWSSVELIASDLNIKYEELFKVTDDLTIFKRIEHFNS